MKEGRKTDRLTEALRGLPTEETVPTGLDAQVLRKLGTTAESAKEGGRPGGWLRFGGSPFGRLWGVGGGLLVGVAAGLALGLVGNAPSSGRVDLGTAEVLVDGQMKIGLPAAELTIDGKVGLQGEPEEEGARGAWVEVPMDVRSGLAGAVAGGLLTVVVYEGKATMEVPGQAPEELRAGESRRLGGNSPVEKEAISRPSSSPPNAGRDAVDADERIAALEMENSILRGQLAAYGGAPVEWPTDLPGVFRAEAWGSWAREQASGLEGYALLEVDCAEFPCLAVFSGDGAPRREDGGVDWQPAVARFENPPPGSPPGTEVGLGVSAIRDMDESGKPVDRMVLWAAPRDYLDGNVQSRLKSRAESLVESSGDEENVEE